MKTWRLRLIARQSAVRSKNERRRSSAILFVLQKETGAVVVVLVLICLDVCFLLCWNFLDPERIQRIPLQSSVHERAEVEFCTSSHPLQWRYIFAVYCSVLLLFALYMSWDARNLNIPFITNPKLLILSILSICGITIAYFILVFVFVAIDGGLMFVLAAVITLLMTGTVLVIEFVPKASFYGIYYCYLPCTCMIGARCRCMLCCFEKRRPRRDWETSVVVRDSL
eukprot:m.88827 g.88827  ORF g.88827 m.88827 type:complete len:225 (+) comp36588_c0_seq21:1851-2525(+)